MKKLLNVLAIGLVSLPLTLNAGVLPTAPKSDLSATHSLADWCYIYWNGVWYKVPC
jgi:hypothetical protein